MDDDERKIKAVLNVSGKGEVELPLYKASAGSDVIDISSLHKKFGLFAYDYGFISTASCISSITYVDGAQGLMSYRGYDIRALVRVCDYVDVIYLLLYGELPGEIKRDNLLHHIYAYDNLMAEVKKYITVCSRNDHPMGILMTSFAGMSAAVKDDAEYIAKSNIDKALHAQALMFNTVPLIFRHISDLSFVARDDNVNYTANLVHMMFDGIDANLYQDPEIAKALDIIMMLHADHEQNASTSTLRMTASTGANLLPCVTAAIAALWGSAHGGANEAVMKMLSDIAEVENVASFIAKVKDRDANVRLMGFGHRVYKNFDPRALALKDICESILCKVRNNKYDKLFKIASALEKEARQDSYFIERKLYPNVDFYSGLLLTAIGIPSNFFTVIFALSRIAGWISHWLESVTEEKRTIYRPRQLYKGYVNRSIDGKG